jgi:hypothetical protein
MVEVELLRLELAVSGFLAEFECFLRVPSYVEKLVSLLTRFESSQDAIFVGFDFFFI